MGSSSSAARQQRSEPPRGGQGRWTCLCRAGELHGLGGAWKGPGADASVPCPCAGNRAVRVCSPSTPSVLAAELEWKDEGGCCHILCSRRLCRDLRCGKLVCEYPGSKPFTKEKAAVIYARVQNTLCVTLDYMKPLTERDPMLVNDGTVCDEQKVSDPLTCSCSLGRRTWRKHRCSSSTGALGGFSVGSTLKELGWMDGGGVTPSRQGPARSLMLPCEFPKDLQLS